MFWGFELLPPTLTNSTVSGNTATVVDGGGGIWNKRLLYQDLDLVLGRDVARTELEQLEPRTKGAQRPASQRLTSRDV
jgi:hypothetical protein